MDTLMDKLLHNLDRDEMAWVIREAVDHPEVPIGKTLDAVAQVHSLHLAGGCS